MMADHGRIRFERLSSQDLANLVVEATDTPLHMSVLAIFDGRGIDPGSPTELLARLRAHVDERLAMLPELTKTLRKGALPASRPVWVEAERFRIADHVLWAEVAAPGREQDMLAIAEDLITRLIERSRPLWELWLITGLADRRFGVLLKVHHAVTDGLGMLRIAQALFDVSADIRPAVPPPVRPAAAAPSDGELARSSFADAARALVRAAAGVMHPVRLARSGAAIVTTLVSVSGRVWFGKHPNINHPIGGGRKLGVVRLDLAGVKELAHANGVKVNDVVLDLAAAGIGAALESRGRDGDRLAVRGLMAVNLPASEVAGLRNRAASALVRLPLGPESGSARLQAIAADSRRARKWQHPRVVERSLVIAARLGLGRFLSRRQRSVELAVSNLVGPTHSLYLFGCPLVDAVPITPISGNVTISFCALSYAGRFIISVLADAASWHDLQLVVEGMESEWTMLHRRTPRAA